jgi:hypothetical protein
MCRAKRTKRKITNKYVSCAGKAESFLFETIVIGRGRVRGVSLVGSRDLRRRRRRTARRFSEI